MHALEGLLQVGGGLLAALLWLTVASFRRVPRATVITYGILAFFCLIAQAASWRILDAFRQPSPFASNLLVSVFTVAAMLCLAWFAVLLSRPRA